MRGSLKIPPVLKVGRPANTSTGPASNRTHFPERATLAKHGPLSLFEYFQGCASSTLISPAWYLRGVGVRILKSTKLISSDRFFVSVGMSRCSGHDVVQGFARRSPQLTWVNIPAAVIIPKAEDFDLVIFRAGFIVIDNAVHFWESCSGVTSQSLSFNCACVCVRALTLIRWLILWRVQLGEDVFRKPRVSGLLSSKRWTEVPNKIHHGHDRLGPIRLLPAGCATLQRLECLRWCEGRRLDVSHHHTGTNNSKHEQTGISVRFCPLLRIFRAACCRFCSFGWNFWLSWPFCFLWWPPSVCRPLQPCPHLCVCLRSRTEYVAAYLF